MSQALRSLLLITLLLFTLPSSTFAYNNSWSSHEDVTKPDPDPDCPGECCYDGCDKPDPCQRKGSPVYLQSGHFTWTDTDIVLQGKPSLRLSRGYTSQEPRVGLFGNGWISEFEESAHIRTRGLGNQWVWTEGNFRLSSGLRFTAKSMKHGFPNTEGIYEFFPLEFPKGMKGYSVEYELKSYGHASHKYLYRATLTMPDGRKNIFDGKSGKLLKKIDRYGNITNYEYNDNTRLSKVVSETGNSLSFSYNSNGFVSQITDHTGRVWQYNYDASGNLIEVVDALGNTKTYTYQEYSPENDQQVYQQLTSIVDATGKPIVSVVYKDAQTKSYTKGENTYTYTYAANSAQKIDSTGSLYKFAWNTSGLVTKRIDPLNSVFEILYDENLSIIGFINPNDTNISIKRDELDRILESTDELNQTTTYTYEGKNSRPSTITSPLGHTTSITYDSKTNPLQMPKVTPKASNMTAEVMP